MTPRETIRTAPWWTRVTKIGDLQAQDVEWAVDQIAPMGCVTLFAGAYASYKSTLARDISRAVASGDQFAGCECPKSRAVLYIDRENSQSQIARSWRASRATDELAADFVYLGDWVDLPNRRKVIDPGSDELAQWSAERGGVILFDTLTRFHQVQENDNGAMARVMEKFVALARRGSAVIVLHHRGKNKEAAFRGAEDIVGAVDIAYTVDRTSAAGIELKQIKNRIEPETAWNLTFRNGFHREGA